MMRDFVSSSSVEKNRLEDSRDQVGLELVEVDVEGTVESQRGGDRRDDVSDQPVEVLVGRLSDVEISLADVVDAGLRIYHQLACFLISYKLRPPLTPRCQP